MITQEISEFLRQTSRAVVIVQLWMEQNTSFLYDKVIKWLLIVLCIFEASTDLAQSFILRIFIILDIDLELTCVMYTESNTDHYFDNKLTILANYDSFTKLEIPIYQMSYS